MPEDDHIRALLSVFISCRHRRVGAGVIRCGDMQDECHAFDGSPWLKVLNETGTAADAANATVVVPASPPPAGDANGTLDEVSSQGGLLAGYIGAAVMGLISLLV